MTDRPYLKDDDKGEITVTLDGVEIRGWSYKTEDEFRMKMLLAREYIEGWCDGVKWSHRVIDVRKELIG